MIDNPLLSDEDRPPFSRTLPKHIEPAIESAIACHAAAIEAINEQPDPDFETIFLAKERADARLGRVWAVVSHLKSVADSPELRAVYQQVQPRLIAYRTRVGQNGALFAAIDALLHEGHALSSGERRAVDLATRSFRRSGVALPEPDRVRLANINVELGSLSSAFANAVLDATESWTLLIEEASELSGIPDAERDILVANAAASGKTGWLINLHAPSWRAVITFADNRRLRAALYHAFHTRASDQGPDAGRFDNSDRIVRILRLRREAAELLGFGDALEKSLEVKMARNADEVLEFLSSLANSARPAAEAELSELRGHAAGLGLPSLEPWDVAYVAEKLRAARYDLDQSAIRRFFPLAKVWEGLFALVSALYGISLVEEQDVDCWHGDVRYVSVRRNGGAAVAGLYVDLYARAAKRAGAWMDVCRPRVREPDRLRPPIAYLTCNFARPDDGEQAFLSHGEVVTLFHELGHCLHHLLSEVDLPSVGGIAGFEWDAIELPSQMMENFAWDPAILASISCHAETGEPLSGELIQRMVASRNFQAALALLRQVEISLIDLRLHLVKDVNERTAGEVVGQVRSEIAVIHPPEWTRFVHSFTHVFAGGYAAGYYSYLWAERLAADAFERFRDERATLSSIGMQFRDEILARGATRPALESFVAFRGRLPINDPLLEQKGLVR